MGGWRATTVVQQMSVLVYCRLVSLEREQDDEYVDQRTANGTFYQGLEQSFLSILNLA